MNEEELTQLKAVLPSPFGLFMHSLVNDLILHPLGWDLWRTYDLETKKFGWRLETKK